MMEAKAEPGSLALILLSGAQATIGPDLPPARDAGRYWCCKRAGWLIALAKQ